MAKTVTDIKESKSHSVVSMNTFTDYYFFDAVFIVNVIECHRTDKSIVYSCFFFIHFVVSNEMFEMFIWKKKIEQSIKTTHRSYRQIALN